MHASVSQCLLVRAGAKGRFFWFLEFLSASANAISNGANGGAKGATQNRPLRTASGAMSGAIPVSLVSLCQFLRARMSDFGISNGHSGFLLTDFYEQGGLR